MPPENLPLNSRAVLLQHCPLFSCRKDAALFGGPGGDIIHQAGREAIIGFLARGLQLRSDGVHLGGIKAAFDDRRHERGKGGFCPAAFLEELRMNEGQPPEGMFALDRTVHVHAAFLAGVPLDQGGGIDDGELVAVLQHLDAFCRRDRHDRNGGAFWLPALGATAGVVVGDVALDPDLHRIARALADKRSAGKSSVSCSKA